MPEFTGILHETGKFTGDSMRWDLLLSDTLARLIGLIGMVAAIPFFADAVSGGNILNREMPLEATLGIGGTIVLVALLFLVPKPFEVALRVSRPWLIRPGFFSLAVMWAILVFLGLDQTLQITIDQTLGQQLATIIWWTIPVFGVLFAVLVFPFGYGWRAYRDIHQQHEALRVQRLEQEVAASTVPGSRKLENGMVLRKQDFFDNLMMVPLGLLMLAGGYGFKFDTTVQTAEWDQWADANAVIGTLAVSAAVFGPMVAMNLIRGMPYNPRAMASKWGRRVLATIMLPPLGYLCFVIAAYDAFPSTWNLINEAEQGTLRYEVLDVSSSRRVRDCVQIQLVGDPDRTMYVCNVSGQLVRDLRPGEIIEATGPLSEYGHSFEQINVVR